MVVIALKNNLQIFPFYLLLLRLNLAMRLFKHKNYTKFSISFYFWVKFLVTFLLMILVLDGSVRETFNFLFTYRKNCNLKTKIKRFFCENCHSENATLH